MAQNIIIAGASYSSVPAVDIPKTGGGSARFVDSSDANAAASDIQSGKTAYVNGIKITGTGGGQPFAFVVVNYTSGSTLTATNCDGYRDITATQRIYYVSEPSGSTQTCVFTITDGTQTVTKTAENITIGTSRTILLEYLHYLYHRGDECTDITGGWIAGSSYSGSSSIIRGTESIKVYIASPPDIDSMLTHNTIDTSGFTQLCATIKCYNAYYARFALTNSDNWYGSAIASQSLNETYSEETTIRLPLSSAYNAYVQFVTGNGTNCYIEVFDVWLE